MRRIVFALRNPAFFRFTEGIIRSLLERGHSVTVISGENPPKTVPVDIQACVMQINAQVARNGNRAKLVFLPLTVDQRWRMSLLSLARRLRSYSYRLSGEYQWTKEFRERWVSFMPYPIQRVFHWAGRHRVEALLRSRIIRAGLAAIESLVRPHPRIVSQLRELNPDVVIATPGVYPQYSGEVDYLKAGQMLGRTSCVLVASWDNLSHTGTFPMVPEAVLVWCEAQINEAVHIHSMPKERITAVGAPVFDQWFSLDYVEPRRVFCKRAGLNPTQPYVVYAVSSPVVGDESAIVVRLTAELTARVRGIQLLVRPHPNLRGGLERWNGLGLRVWPPVGVFPITVDQKRDYFNTLYHAAAVIGLNTTVFLEAMILDKLCVSIANQVAARAPYKHYEYLMNADCCEFVTDEAAAAVAVRDLLRGRDAKREARKKFVKHFIRPRGLNQPAAQAAAEVIESLCSNKNRVVV